LTRIFENLFTGRVVLIKFLQLEIAVKNSHLKNVWQNYWKHCKLNPELHQEIYCVDKIAQIKGLASPSSQAVALLRIPGISCIFFAILPRTAMLSGLNSHHEVLTQNPD
jgi:hypothetical protein